MRELHALNDLEEHILLVRGDLFTHALGEAPGRLLVSVPTEPAASCVAARESILVSI